MGLWGGGWLWVGVDGVGGADGVVVVLGCGCLGVVGLFVW